MRELLDESHPDCLWVFNGEGVATQKYDGTCCLIKDGKYFKRREVKKGAKIPDGFIEVDSDENTGKRVGWLEVDSSLKENQWHMEAFQSDLECGTYELIGPKIQGNPENFGRHELIPHKDAFEFNNVPRNLVGIREWLSERSFEGIVFHHKDGRMAKIKKRDFGLKRINKRI